MKQSAVEWLESKLTIEQWNELQDLLYEAKQMEAEQSKIPELSDDEIEQGVNDPNTDAYDFREGAKWYREQLKQK